MTGEAVGFVRRLTEDDISQASFQQACLALPKAWAPAGEALRVALTQRAQTGELLFFAWRHNEAAEVWQTVFVTQALAPGHLLILGTLGDWCSNAVGDVLMTLQSQNSVLSLVPEQFPHPLDELWAHGFLRAERQVWRNELQNEDFSGWEPIHFRVLPWSETWRDPACALLVSAHANSVSGLILAWPNPPSQDVIRNLGRRLGLVPPTLLAASSFVALEADRDEMLGLIWIEDGATGPVLHELCVAEAARRRGVARALVGAAQSTLQQAGYAQMLYTTLQDNVGVARLAAPHNAYLVDKEGFVVWLSPVC
ncbi:MAG: GNAT family N-acetyltransferase [Candidatus Sericytochromatia bacterium]|nr:GNAT family N-acetyltransferase [Candidatus Sericytochromatia bacterium]